MPRLYYLFSLLLIPLSHWAQTPALIKDINPGNGDGFYESAYQPVVVNGILYFAATDPTTGTELWRSDGTETGTYLVKDINPGSADSAPAHLTDVNGTLYFYASTATTGYELWRSDGTQIGTYLVKDLNPGTGGSGFYYASFKNLNGTLYFQASLPSVNSSGLWRSDGTEAGTQPVAFPGHVLTEAFEMEVVNNRLFLIAADIGYLADEIRGNQLYAVDGATGSVYLVNKSTPVGFRPLNLVRSGDLIYYLNKDDSHSYELWRSDGTAEGTRMARQLRPDGNNALGDERFGSLTDVNGILYFSYTDDYTGNELWRSDGSEKGTYMVKDIRSGIGNSGPSQLTNVNGVLYFRANTAREGTELWRSDGTATGTYLVKDILPGTDSSFPQTFFGVDNTLYFTAFQSDTGYELWRSDGTANGTSLVADIYPGSSGSHIYYMTSGNGKLYFRANDGVHGDEPWSLDNRISGGQCRSLQSGDWTSAATWSCGHEPTLTDAVIINPHHIITVSIPTAQAGQLIYNGGTLLFTTGSAQVLINRE